MPLIIPYGATRLADLSAKLQPIIQRGGIVAVPTETFYGLGVNPFDPGALARLTAVKGRPQSAPILVLVAALHDLSLFALRVPEAASILIDAFWPGALTILFPARPSVPSAVTGGSGRVGLRLSSCQPLRELLDRVGPLTGTSANRTGAAPARTASPSLIRGPLNPCPHGEFVRWLRGGAPPIVRFPAQIRSDPSSHERKSHAREIHHRTCAT